MRDLDVRQRIGDLAPPLPCVLEPGAPRELEPGVGTGRITLEPATALFVELRQSVLRSREILLGGLPEPVCRGAGIPVDASAEVVEEPEVELRLGRAGLGQRKPQTVRDRVITAAIRGVGLREGRVVRDGGHGPVDESGTKEETNRPRHASDNLQPSSGLRYPRYRAGTRSPRSRWMRS